MSRGDSFKPSLAKLNSLNPDQDKWTDRLEYMMRLLLGNEIPAADQATIQVDNSAFAALGQPKDIPASPSTLNTTPATPYTQIQLLKALLLLSSTISSDVNNVEPLLGTVNSNLNAVNTNLNDINSNVSDVEVEVAGLNTAFSSFATGNHSDLIDIEDAIGLVKTAVDGVKDSLKPLVAGELTNAVNDGTVQDIPADPTRRGLYLFNNSTDSLIYLTYDGTDPSATNASDMLEAKERRLISSPASAIKFIAISPTTLDGYLHITEHF